MSAQKAQFVSAENNLRDAAAARGLTVEYYDMGPRNPYSSPYRYRLAVGNDEHPTCCGIAWRTEDEREESIRWALDAVLRWPVPNGAGSDEEQS